MPVGAALPEMISQELRANSRLGLARQARPLPGDEEAAQSIG